MPIKRDTKSLPYGDGGTAGTQPEGFPTLQPPPAAVQDTGLLRYGDGFITGQYPPVPDPLR